MLRRELLCVRLMQKHMEIFPTTAKFFVWRLRPRVQKEQSSHYWHMGGKSKICSPIQISGSCTGYWAPRWQRHSKTTAIKILCSKQAASLFSRCSKAVYFFVRFVRPCMHHNYGGISESHPCKVCVWPIILNAELYTSCPGERVLVVMTHQVQCNIPTFEAVLKKICTYFSKDAEGPLT